jgi:hypothetical protein
MAYDLLAAFPTQDITKKRQYGGLLRWAKPKALETLPTEKPAEQWVRERMVAERIPQQINNYVDWTMSYTAMDTQIATNMRNHLNAYNTTGMETQLDAEVDAALNLYLPLFCTGHISESMVTQWYIDHGFEVTSPAVRSFPAPSAAYDAGSVS